MARIFITGSSDGLGFLAGKLLLEQGHEVVLHARSQARAADTRAVLPRCAGVVIGDVSSIADMRAIAEQVNALGPFSAVIHNVGIGYREPRRVETTDGLSQLFAVNVAAPYVLTALIARPKRLVYLSSGMHTGGDAGLDDPQWKQRRWNGSQAYSDSKLHDLTLALAIARHWTGTLSNAVHPGWVPTRMGGSGAPDDLSQGAVTQAWLAVSDDPAALVTGGYFQHQKRKAFNPVAGREEVQDRLMQYLRDITGVEIA